MELSDKDVLAYIDHLNGRKKWDTPEVQRLFEAAVDILVERGVYPPLTPRMIELNYDYRKLVEAWGVRWYIYAEPLNCEFCGADLRDLEFGPPLKRELGHYDQLTDVTIGFECPDCKGRWARKGFRLPAKKFVEGSFDVSLTTE